MCATDNLSLNVSKPNELVLWGSSRGATHIIENLTWSTRTDISGGKVRNHLYHLRQFKRVSGGPEDLFFSGPVESILKRIGGGGIAKQYWNGNCSAPDHRALQRLVCLAELTVGSILPTVLHLFTGRHRARAGRIINHPGNVLFSFYTHNPFCTSTVSPSERAKETVSRPSGWHRLKYVQLFCIFYNKDWMDIYIGIKAFLLYIQEEITEKKPSPTHLRCLIFIPEHHESTVPWRWMSRRLLSVEVTWI